MPSYDELVTMMRLYQQTIEKSTVNAYLRDLITTLLPSTVLGANTKEEIAYKKPYKSHIALSYCKWVQYNRDWVNVLIFDLDHKISTEDAWRLCEDKLDTHPSWVCATDKGVQVAFVLENRIAYEWKDTIKLARKIKRVVSDALGADPSGSYRLRGWWRNPYLHDNYHDTSHRIALKSFYHLLPTLSPTHKFKKALIEHKRATSGFMFERGFRNDWLWYRGMQITKNKSEYDDLDSIVYLLNSMNAYEALQNREERLDEKEVIKIACSIHKYNSKGSNFVSSGVNTDRDINEGVMGFERIKGLSEEQYKAEVKRRQKLSAERTNKGRNMATRQKHMEKVNKGRSDKARRTVIQMITGLLAHEYKKPSGDWNASQIAKETGLTRQTVAKYIKEFEDSKEKGEN